MPVNGVVLLKFVQDFRIVSDFVRAVVKNVVRISVNIKNRTVSLDFKNL